MAEPLQMQDQALTKTFNQEEDDSLRAKSNAQDQVQALHGPPSNPKSNSRAPGLGAAPGIKSKSSKLSNAAKEKKPPEASRYQLFVKAMTAKLKSEDPTCNQVR